MSNDEPKQKKIKLSLEPSINNKIADITEKGQHIFKTEPTLQEKLMQNVDRIWYERGGDWTHITEKSLLEAIQVPQDENDEQDNEATTATNDENASPIIPPPPPTGYDINKLRDSVINKLYHAKSEIDVALDVINILAAGNRANTTASKENLVIPNGSLTATYVTKPKPTQKAQLESVQLNLGLKRTKQKQTSDFLKKSAASLSKLVEKEQVFWDEALDLRRNNWMIQAPAGAAAGSSFLIDYGFGQVGSDFQEASMGELRRSVDESKHLQLALPHGTSKRLAVRINQSHTAGLVGGQKAFSEGILGISSSSSTTTEEEPAAKNQQQDVVYSTSSTIATANSNTHSEIQNQLAKAHSTVFDAELFSDILGEAQALNSNVRFPDDEIVINIDGQIDLSIRKIQGSSLSNSTTTSTQRIISQTIDLSFRLLLLQHQQFNMWKVRAKILSSNPKIHHLLTLAEQEQFLAAQALAAANVAVVPVGTPTNQQQQNNMIPNSVVPTTINTNNPNATPTVGAANAATASSAVAAGLLPPQQGQQQQQRPNSTGSSSGAGMGARTKAAAVVGAANNNNKIVKKLPKHIPILLPILSFTRFWVQFDRIRHVVSKITKPFTSSGLSLSVHFLMSNSSDASQVTSRYESYPGYGEIALSLGISLLKGPSLHFGLNQSGSISVYLPQTTVNLQNVSEFEAFLSREIKVICLRVVCDVANGKIIQHNKVSASKEEEEEEKNGLDKQRWLWKVDQVDEAIHGSVFWKSVSVWRNIHVSLDEKKLVFRLNKVNDQLKEQVYSLNLNSVATTTEMTDKEALNFKERACIIIQKIMSDATMTNAQ